MFVGGQELFTLVNLYRKYGLGTITFERAQTSCHVQKTSSDASSSMNVAAISFIYKFLMFSGTWGHLPDQIWMKLQDGETGLWKFFYEAHTHG